jgi:hypothetical protein
MKFGISNILFIYWRILISILCILPNELIFHGLSFANWHSLATLIEVFPCIFLSCRANARVYLANTGHGPHSSKLMNCVVLFIVCVCVLY